MGSPLLSASQLSSGAEEGDTNTDPKDVIAIHFKKGNPNNGIVDPHHRPEPSHETFIHERYEVKWNQKSLEHRVTHLLIPTAQFAKSNIGSGKQYSLCRSCKGDRRKGQSHTWPLHKQVRFDSPDVGGATLRRFSADGAKGVNQNEANMQNKPIKLPLVGMKYCQQKCKLKTQLQMKPAEKQRAEYHSPT